MQHIEAIILAGGTGSRFGGGKLLAPYRGGALIDGAVRAATGSPVKRTILVTGYRGEELVEAVAAATMRDPVGSPLDVVHAVHYAEGVAATLRAGIAALSPDAEGALVFLGDMPSIPHTVAAKLVAAIGGRAAAAPIYKGERGHPVLVARRLFSAILDLTGDKGARALLEGLGDDLALVSVEDEGVVFDVDRWADLTA